MARAAARWPLHTTWSTGSAPGLRHSPTRFGVRSSASTAGPPALAQHNVAVGLGQQGQMGLGPAVGPSRKPEPTSSRTTSRHWMKKGSLLGASARPYDNLGQILGSGALFQISGIELAVTHLPGGAPARSPDLGGIRSPQAGVLPRRRWILKPRCGRAISFNDLKHTPPERKRLHKLALLFFPNTIFCSTITAFK